MTARPLAAPLSRPTGAVAAGTKLHIVSLEWDEAFGYLLDPKLCAVFELEERSSAAIREVSCALQHFLWSSGITRLALRYSPDTKQYRPCPFVLKHEAALQLVPGVDVDLVANASVSAWVNREDPPLPVYPDPSIAKSNRGAIIKAIEIAAFAGHLARDPRYFPQVQGVGV